MVFNQTPPLQDTRKIKKANAGAHKTSPNNIIMVTIRLNRGDMAVFETVRHPVLTLPQKQFDGRFCEVLYSTSYTVNWIDRIRFLLINLHR